MTSDKREGLIERLLRRFKGVPNFNEEDAIDLIDEALSIHEDDASADLALLYAQYQGAWQIAMSVAHYFKFSDGEESVDKSMLADNYRKLAQDFELKYDSEKGKQRGGNFHVMPRPDRP